MFEDNDWDKPQIKKPLTKEEMKKLVEEAKKNASNDDECLMCGS